MYIIIGAFAGYFMWIGLPTIAEHTLGNIFLFISFIFIGVIFGGIAQGVLDVSVFTDSIKDNKNVNVEIVDADKNKI